MHIMKDVYIHMRVPGEREQSFKDKFVKERTRQFDILRDKEEFSSKFESSKKRVEKFLQTKRRTSVGPWNQRD